MARKRIYGEVNSANDIRKINSKIRGQIRRARSKPRITELVKRSAYLCTLTYAPGWKKKFGRSIKTVRSVAKAEYRKTAKTANAKIGEKVYDEVWGR